MLYVVPVDNVGLLCLYLSGYFLVELRDCVWVEGGLMCPSVDRALHFGNRPGSSGHDWAASCCILKLCICCGVVQGQATGEHMVTVRYRGMVEVGWKTG